ncbi:TRAP transporter large permease [Ancylobacter mangrovi]|uniref:TRAP transporter large permease n=1 Tax=Ancylobacter mangrovi TaxID=2972472 RepID=UPI002162A32B|nr:TRAP transporter large permease [Ancylobacter mangrovi]MCS0502021.1 TRAP transporter large permease [Ancylobacter mangrovi]
MLPVILTLALIGLIMSGLMIAVAAGLASIVGGLALFGDPLGARVPMMISRFSIDRIDNFLLLAIPFFILAGRLMNTGGVTVRLFDFVAALVQPLRGGLGHANVLASFVFAGMSGSATADVVGLGAVEMKAMRAKNYPDAFSAGVTAASSLLGPVIPPSIVLIAYAVQAEQSVATLFLAAIVPGILLALAFMSWVAYQAHVQKMPEGSWPSASEVGRKAVHALLPMLTPGIILTGIYGGVFTPTEAAAVAVLYALLLTTLVYRELTWRDLLEQLKGTALDTATLMFIIAMTSAFGVIMLRLGLPQALVGLVVGISSNPTIVMFLLLIVWLLVGCFMAQTPAIIILTPILMPIASQIGLDMVHFGVVMALALTVGLLTPPVGMVLYALKKVADVPLGTLFRVSVPYVVIAVAVLCLLILVPGLVTALPYAFGLH